MNRSLICTLIFCLLGGCSTPQLPQVPSGFSSEALIEGKVPPPVDQEAKERVSLSDRLPTSTVDNPLAGHKFYSFKARSLPVTQAMQIFGQTYGINVSVDADVNALISADFKGLPLEKGLEVMLEANGMSWEWSEGLLRVTKQQTRMFNIDYLRLIRVGNGSSISTSSTGGSTTTQGVSNTDRINFWDEVENQINTILTKGVEDYAANQSLPQETTVINDRVTNTTTTATKPVKESIGRVTLNRLTGTVQVTTSSKRMRMVESYIKSLSESALRQVYIEVKILEVDLSSSNSYGVDWTKIDAGSLTMNTSTSLTNSASGAAVSQAGIGGTYDRSYATGRIRSLTGVFKALQEQGNVRVVTQPRIRTLNNQPAIVRAGTERTFYTTQTTVAVTNGTAVTTTNNTPTTVTEGVVLGLTPQISADGVITLDVAPVLTRVTGVDMSPDGKSSAPRLDVRQTSTIVRVPDGETVLIGGLIQESADTTQRSVPLLGDIPGISTFFGSTYQGKGRRELVVILTPYIIR